MGRGDDHTGKITWRFEPLPRWVLQDFWCSMIPSAKAVYVGLLHPDLRDWHSVGIDGEFTLGELARVCGIAVNTARTGLRQCCDLKLVSAIPRPGRGAATQYSLATHSPHHNKKVQNMEVLSGANSGKNLQINSLKPPNQQSKTSKICATNTNETRNRNPIGRGVQRARGKRGFPTVSDEDLANDAALLKIRDQLVRAGVIPQGDRGIQIVFESAQHALKIGNKNPAGEPTSRSQPRCGALSTEI